MFPLETFTQEFAVSIDAHDVYPHWTPGRAGNASDLRVIGLLVWKRGYRPKRMVFHPGGGIAWIFDSWGEAERLLLELPLMLDLWDRGDQSLYDDKDFKPR